MDLLNTLKSDPVPILLRDPLSPRLGCRLTVDDTLIQVTLEHLAHACLRSNSLRACFPQLVLTVQLSATHHLDPERHLIREQQNRILQVLPHLLRLRDELSKLLNWGETHRPHRPVVSHPGGLSPVPLLLRCQVHHPLGLQEPRPQKPLQLVAQEPSVRLTLLQGGQPALNCSLPQLLLSRHRALVLSSLKPGEGVYDNPQVSTL